MRNKWKFIVKEKYCEKERFFRSDWEVWLFLWIIYVYFCILGCFVYDGFVVYRYVGCSNGVVLVGGLEVYEVGL